MMADTNFLDENCKCMMELIESINDPNEKVRNYAFEQIASLSASVEGRELILKCDCIRHLIRKIGDCDLNVVKNVMTCLINIAEFDNWAKYLIDRNVVSRLMDELLDSNTDIRVFSLYVILLSNLTRFEFGARKFLNLDDGENMQGFYLSKLIPFFLQDFDGSNKEYFWVGNVIANATIMDQGRRVIMANGFKIFRQLVPQILSNLDMRRQSVLEIILNCLIMAENHQEILEDQNMDLVTHLCLLIRSDYILDGDDVAGIPPRLVPPRGQIKLNIKCKKLIIDIFTALVKTRFGREYLKAHGVYTLIRKWHELENDEELRNGIYDFIHFLVLDDPEIEESRPDKGKEDAEILPHDSNVGSKITDTIEICIDEYGNKIEVL